MNLRVATILCLLVGGLVVGLSLRSDSFADEPADRAATGGPAFGSVQIYADPAGQPLAAYQFELRAQAEGIKLVGIENGAHAAYADPPHYDRKAIDNDHVIIAAFSTAPAADLPTGRTRITTIGYMSETGAPPHFVITPVTAATPGLDRITVTYELVIPTPEGTAP